jgi:putative RNA 2'-phosphotransferase
VTDDLTATSRFLAYVLRHNPAAVGVELDENGWVGIDVLLEAAARHGRRIEPGTLVLILAGGGKRRFETRDGKIRAAQGHSVAVDLGLDPRRPPELLYHGTVERFLAGIRTEGLTPGNRTHVHLSADRETATAVGARRGAPVILAIDALAMHEHGHVFYRASNGVWLTDHVPPEWIHNE